MDFSGLLTFLGLVIAAYSVLPEHSKLSVRVFIGKWTWILGLLVLTMCVYLIYISRKISVDLIDYPERDYFGAADLEFIAFCSIVIFSLFVIVRLKYAKVRPSNIKNYRDLLEELSLQKEYNLLAQSFVRNLERLLMYSNQRTPLQRFVNWYLRILRPSNLSSAELRFGGLISVVKFVPLFKEEEVIQVDERNIFKKLRDYLLSDLPKYLYIRLYRITQVIFFDKAVSEVASEILNKFVYKRDFSRYLVSHNPKIALKLLKNDSSASAQSPHNLIEAFVSDNESLFYSEVYKASNEGIDNEVPLMKVLAKDCEKAQKLNVYRPVGEYGIQYLKDIARMDKDELQQEMDVRFEEYLKLKNPIYAGIFFFDVLVKQAIKTGVEWHMWLYYLSYWTKGIVENAKAEYWTEKTEFPNRYAYLLYELTSTQKYWIVDNMGKGIIKVANVNKHDNGNIFKSACDSLTRGTSSILSSEEIPDRFKIYIADMVWNLVLMLKNSQSEDEKRLGSYLILSMKREFTMLKYHYGYSERVYSAYNTALRAVDWHRYPHDLYTELRDDWSNFDYTDPPF